MLEIFYFVMISVFLIWAWSKMTGIMNEYI